MLFDCTMVVISLVLLKHLFFPQQGSLQQLRIADNGEEPPLRIKKWRDFENKINRVKDMYNNDEIDVIRMIRMLQNQMVHLI